MLLVRYKKRGALNYLNSHTHLTQGGKKKREEGRERLLHFLFDETMLVIF